MAYVGRPGATAPLTTADIPDNSVTAAKVTADVATQAEIDLKANIASPTFTGTPAVPTASAATNTTQVASTAYVRTEVSNLVDSAPGALDTLNELAAALGDDANFSTTVTNSIATKLPLAGGTMSGAVTGMTGLTGGTGDFNWDSNTLVVDSSESRVGIGVADPAAPLEIKASGSLVIFDTPGASQNAWLTWADNGTNKWEINKSTVQDFTVYSYTLGANVMTMKETGNVGIGTTAPAHRTHIYGSNGSGSFAAGLVKIENTNDGPGLWIQTLNDTHTDRGPFQVWNGSKHIIKTVNNGAVYKYNNSTSWDTTSDERVKTNISTLSNSSLEKINQLRPIAYEYTEDFNEQNSWEDKQRYGFIAQEYKTVFPEAVSLSTVTLDGEELKDFHNLDTGDLTAHLVASIQVLTAKVTALENA